MKTNRKTSNTKSEFGNETEIKRFEQEIPKIERK